MDNLTKMVKDLSIQMIDHERARIALEYFIKLIKATNRTVKDQFIFELFSEEILQGFTEAINTGFKTEYKFKVSDTHSMTTELIDAENRLKLNYQALELSKRKLKEYLAANPPERITQQMGNDLIEIFKLSKL